MAKKKKVNSKSSKGSGNRSTFTRTVETETSTVFRPKSSKDETTYRDAKRGKSRAGARNKYETRHDAIANNAATLQGKENDPSWYNSNGQLVTDAASVSFYTPAGAPYFSSQSDRFDNSKGSAVPGIMTLDVVPCPGLSTDRSSALNLAALKLYTGMRKANSGAVNYSHADLMMYCLAMDSVYIMYAEALRLYGVLNCWSQYNRYKPQDIVRAMGYDYDGFRQNMADFRAWLNVWIKRANSFSLPVSFSLSKRHAWLFSNIWADSTNAKAQLYLYRPALYYIWDDQSSDQGSKLRAQYWNSNGAWHSPTTFSSLKNHMDDMLDAIANSDDIAIMGGDLEKAFGSENMFNMASIDENYTIEPTFSEEVLMQIENTMFLPRVLKDTPQEDLDITQNVTENMIVYNPKLTYSAKPEGQWQSTDPYYLDYVGLFHDGYPLNVHFDNPKPDDVMVATRNKFDALVDAGEYTADEGGNIYIQFYSLGCDFVTDVTIWTKVNYDTDQSWSTWFPVTSGFEVAPYLPDKTDYSGFTANSLSMVISSTIAVDAFDWHPAVYAAICLQNSPEAEAFARVNFVSMDLDNYTKISDGTLHKIHDAAIYNLWDLPIH